MARSRFLPAAAFLSEDRDGADIANQRHPFEEGVRHCRMLCPSHQHRASARLVARLAPMTARELSWRLLVKTLAYYGAACQSYISKRIHHTRNAPRYARVMIKHMEKDSKLSPQLYNVAREKGTEPPFTGKYWNTHEKGIYTCAICGAELFSSDTKFDSGTGWPSFTEPTNLKNIELRPDNTLGMTRTEVLCKNCGAHLGHVFDDGPKEKGGKRYCINSVCLAFKKEGNGNGK